MAAYYNEHDPKAAAWLRELIARGVIAPGIVDERSIEDVRPDDLDGFVQCHFFAGIGGWSYALRLAGWPDDRPVWSGSCPCQPFSAAGKGRGTADERHLWPAFHWLIAQCRPSTVYGEQVASKAGREWFATVRTDLEVAGYRVGAANLSASSVGAPHIRQRLYFVAKSGSSERGSRGARRHGKDGGRSYGEPAGPSDACELAHDNGTGRDLVSPSRVHGEGQRGDDPAGCGTPDRMVNTVSPRLEGHGRDVGDGQEPGRDGADPAGSVAPAGRVDFVADPAGDERAIPSGSRARPGAAEGAGSPGDAAGCGDTGGFWSDADWIPCRDGKARPVEPGTFPLAHGLPARVVRLRGYGNAIVPQVAQAFIEATSGGEE